MTEQIELLTRPVEYGSLVSVRHAVEREAAVAGLTGDELYWFVVAVNELTTNAVRHGGGFGTLYLWREDAQLHCRVVDEGPGFPPGHQVPTVRPAPATLGGRGLWMASQGRRSVVIHSSTHGSAVTVSQPLPV